jgi:hypothetical protein
MTLEQAYQFCYGDERLAVAITAIDKEKPSMRSMDALKAIEAAERYLEQEEGNVEAIEAGLHFHLTENDPFLNYWHCRGLLSRAVAEGQEDRPKLTKDELAKLLGISPTDAYGLAKGLVALGVIRTAGKKRKEGAKGAGSEVYAFDAGFFERLQQALKYFKE